MLLTPLQRRSLAVIPRRTSQPLIMLIWGNAGKGKAKGKAKGKGKAAGHAVDVKWMIRFPVLTRSKCACFDKSSRFCMFMLCGGYLCSLLTFCCGGHEFNWPDILCKGVGLTNHHQSPITHRSDLVAISKIWDDHGLHRLKSDNFWPFLTIW